MHCSKALLVSVAAVLFISIFSFSPAKGSRSIVLSEVDTSADSEQDDGSTDFIELSNATTSNVTVDNTTTTEPPAPVPTTPPSEQSFVFYLKMTKEEFEKQKPKFIEKIREKLGIMTYTLYRPAYVVTSGCQVLVEATEQSEYLKVTVTLKGCSKRKPEEMNKVLKDVVKDVYKATIYFEKEKVKSGLVGWQIALIVLGAVVVLILGALLIRYVTKRDRVGSEYEMAAGRGGKYYMT